MRKRYHLLLVTTTVSGSHLEVGVKNKIATVHLAFVTLLGSNTVHIATKATENVMGVDNAKKMPPPSPAGI